jgi:hypothetical protein
MNQSTKADIYVSISFSNSNYKKEFTDTLIKYGTTIQFLLSNKQLFQMEHIHKLYKFIKDKEYDLIMFSDDDDTYSKDRVKSFIHAFEVTKTEEFNKLDSNADKNIYDVYNVNKVAGVKEIQKNEDTPEYWCYGVKPIVLEEFFRRFQGNEKLIQHKFGDMYFRLFLRKNKSYNWVGIDICHHKLYNYNINNPDSICESIYNNIEESLLNNILLGTLYCKSDKDFDIMIKGSGISPVLKRKYTKIYHFCKYLFK